ncbi:unnamed protein product, partial [Amoebophrya sp. A25]
AVVRNRANKASATVLATRTGNDPKSETDASQVDRIIRGTTRREFLGEDGGVLLNTGIQSTDTLAQPQA